MNPTELESTVHDLQARIKALEDRLPQSNIIHPRFWPRAWTVYGYTMATGLLISAGILVVAFLFGLITG